MRRLVRLAGLGVAVVLLVRLLNWLMAPALPALETLLVVSAVAVVIVGGRWPR